MRVLARATRILQISRRELSLDVALLRRKPKTATVPRIPHALLKVRDHKWENDESQFIENSGDQYQLSTLDSKDCQFADWRRVIVRGGNGGNGRVSLSSVHGVEFAGADGGNGGRGGHVIFQADRKVRNLSHVPSPVLGSAGGDGNYRKMDGKCAKHRVVKVPRGTIIRSTTGELLGELMQPGEMFVAARGGEGGRGNVCFLSSTNQCPTVAEQGGQGELFLLDIEMRTIADFGLVGFPNAGKSTLLRALSRAKPKVAAYPFTTLAPHVGLVLPTHIGVNSGNPEQCDEEGGDEEFGDPDAAVSVADVPGLVEGAHKNQGLGISFLRHIERCLSLIYVIDISLQDVEAALTQLEILRAEVTAYSPEMASLHRGPGRMPAVVCNKIDILGADQTESLLTCTSDLIGELEHTIKSKFSASTPVFFTSAKYSGNLAPLIHFMYRAKKEQQNSREAANQKDERTAVGAYVDYELPLAHT